MRKLILKLRCKCVKVNLLKKLADRLSAHLRRETALAVLLDITVVFRLGQNILLLQRRASAVKYYIARKIQNFLQILGRHVKQKAHTAGNALEIPDVRYRCRELDVTHALTTDLGVGNLDTAAVADEVLSANLLLLVFAALALKLLGGSEDLLAEQSAGLRLQRSVVDRLRLLDLVVGDIAGSACSRPFTDLIVGSQSDTDGIVGDLFYFLVDLIHSQ